MNILARVLLWSSSSEGDSRQGEWWGRRTLRTGHHLGGKVCFWDDYKNPWLSRVTPSPLNHVAPLQPVPEELQSGPGFGYVVAFRPLGAQGWMQAAVTSPETSRYVFKNESIPPFSPYQVKVGVYNNRGEGPFSPVTTIYSAEEGGWQASRTATQHEPVGAGCWVCRTKKLWWVPCLGQGNLIAYLVPQERTLNACEWHFFLFKDIFLGCLHCAHNCHCAI